MQAKRCLKMQLYVKIRNGTLLLPLLPDPYTGPSASSQSIAGASDSQSAAAAMDALYGVVGAGGSSVRGHNNVIVLLLL